MSTKNFGCFLCEGYSPEECGPCPDCGAPIDVSHELLAGKFDSYEITEIIGRGFSGWTLLGEQRYRQFAIKVIPSFRVEGKGRRTDDEIRRLVQVSRPGHHRNIVEYVTEFNASLKVGGKEQSVYCIVFDYVNAPTLAHFLNNPDLELARSDVVEILQGITAGIHAIHGNGLRHWDLHDHNILVRTTEPSEHTARFEPKIIDFGSARAAASGQPSSAGERSDFYYLSKHILAVSGKFETDIVLDRTLARISPADRQLCAELHILAQRLADHSEARRNIEAAEVYDKLGSLIARSEVGHSFASFSEMKETEGVSLPSPLTLSNALSMRPQDVLLLYSDYLRWIKQISREEVVIIVGPRGCGKTMLLRYLALNTQARPLKKEETPEVVAARLAKAPYAGFFLGLGEMRGAFQRSAYKRLMAEHPELAREFCREYLSGGLLLRVLQTIGWLTTERLAHLDPAYFDALIRFAFQSIGARATDVRGRAGLSVAQEAVDRHVSGLSAMRGGRYEPSLLSGDDFLEQLALALRQIPWFASREIWFLLDDYSVTVIPEFAQEAYNTVVYRISSHYRVRISSEGSGPRLGDELGRKYRESREFYTVNLGVVYFAAKERDGRKFFERILENRFRESDEGSLNELKTLLGEHPHSRHFGRYISERQRAGDTRFHGLGVILKLCSGDIAFVLELLHRLYSAAEGDERIPLSPLQQDEIVKDYAQRKLSELRSVPEFGDRLYAIADRLGRLLREYLRSRGGRPDERLRIEIEGVEPFPSDIVSTHDALLRHNVIIAGGAGKDKSGQPTRKFYVRRLYAPCFPFSPNRRGTVALDVADYAAWLRDPDQITASPQRRLL